MVTRVQVDSINSELEGFAIVIEDGTQVVHKEPAAVQSEEHDAGDVQASSYLIEIHVKAHVFLSQASQIRVGTGRFHCYKSQGACWDETIIVCHRAPHARKNARRDRVDPSLPDHILLRRLLRRIF